MSRNTKRGASSKARKPSPAAEPDAPESSILFGVLGDTFSLGGKSHFFHGHVLFDVLLHAELPARLLHRASEHDGDVGADVIIVPDEVYTQYDGKLTPASLGLDARTIRAVKAANSHQDTKYVPLSHFLTCLPKTEQKHVMKALRAKLPARSRPTEDMVKTFLSKLPALCLSGQVHYAHKNISKVQLAELLNELGIAHSRDCATEDSVILGDSNHAAKYLNGTNVTVLTMWQFQALQSLKSHETIATWYQSMPSSTSTAAAAIEREDEDEVDMDDVVSVKRGRAKSNKSKAPALAPAKRRVRGRAEEDAETPAIDSVSGENEDMHVWDRILF